MLRLLVIISFLIPVPALALVSLGGDNSSFRDTVQKGVLFAQGSRARKKLLQGEARGSSAKTSLDFDAADIDGERRAPVGVAVGGSKQNQGYDLINLRLRWHPEMIKSTSNLETGK